MLNKLNLAFITEIFYRFSNLTHRKDNLYVHAQNIINLKIKAYGQLRHKKWNSSPENIKQKLSVLNRSTNSKILWKKWSVPPWKCNLYHYMQVNYDSFYTSSQRQLQFYYNLKYFIILMLIIFIVNNVHHFGDDSDLICWKNCFYFHTFVAKFSLTGNPGDGLVLVECAWGACRIVVFKVMMFVIIVHVCFKFWISWVSLT